MEAAIDRALVVSVHDVAPPHLPAIEYQLGLLAGVGVNQCVLKVVPNWHGIHPLSGAVDLVSLLHAQSAAGSEIVLHGLEHIARRPLRGTWLDRSRATLFASGAAEFLSLDAHEVQSAVMAGLKMLAAVDIEQPTFFCPPAWLITSDAISALQRTPIRHMVTMFTVTDLATGVRRIVPSFGYMGAGRVQELGVSILNRVMHASLGGFRTVRVFLHPGDLGSPQLHEVIRSIKHLVDMGWRPTTYRELLASG